MPCKILYLYIKTYVVSTQQTSYKKGNMICQENDHMKKKCTKQLHIREREMYNKDNYKFI